MPRCLVIDSSEIVRKVACRIIETFDYTVSETASVNDAVSICQQNMPDVILIDWHWRDSDAHEIVRSIRKMDSAKHPYIIYCTTENDPIDIAQAMSSGADDYILKPFDRAALESKFSLVPLATN